MKIQTYRRVDSFNGVTIYKLGELDYPFRDFIGKRGADIGMVRDYFAQYFDRYEIPYEPVEVLPLLPSGFEYTHAGETNRVENGIAFSNSVDALMSFARENLVFVDHPSSITGQFSGDSEPGLQEKSKFLRQIQSEDPVDIPYDAQPLVYLPDKLKQQDSTRRGHHLTVDFFIETRDDKHWIIFKYKTVNDLLRNPRRFKKKTTVADDIDLRPHDISDLEPMYIHPQDLSIDETNNETPRTWNFVTGCKEKNKNRQYIWNFQDRSGTALTAGELPVDLCEKFEEAGRQVIAPEELSVEAPLRFLEPEAFVGADLGELRDLKSTDLPNVETLVEEDSVFADLLNGPIYVQDVRQPLNFHSLYSWQKKKHQVEKLKETSALEVLKRLGVTEEEIPQINQYSTAELSEMTLEKFLNLTGLTLKDLRGTGNKVSNRSMDQPATRIDSELLAKILQQTQQFIFYPDQPPAGYECMDLYFDADTIWFGLCEPVYRE